MPDKSTEHLEKKIVLNAYAKINLSIDVLGKLPSGYHEVEMVMQQVNLCDKVTISVEEGGGTCSAPAGGGQNSAAAAYRIFLTANKKWLPTDSSNIAYKAVELVIRECRPNFQGTIAIDLKKGIPVAAGLAGGSADAAAVLHGLKQLWNLPLSLQRLMELGLQLGADVPFCIMGQQAVMDKTAGEEMAARGFAAANAVSQLPAVVSKVGTCVLAQGIGEKLTVLSPLNAQILLSKPRYSASTAAVYGGLDLGNLQDRPNTPLLIEGLKENNLFKTTRAMGNVLESVTAALVPQVSETHRLMAKQPGAAKVLMSGSGPSVYGIFTNRNKAEAAQRRLQQLNAETYLVRTLI